MRRRIRGSCRAFHRARSRHLRDAECGRGGREFRGIHPVDNPASEARAGSAAKFSEYFIEARKLAHEIVKPPARNSQLAQGKPSALADSAHNSRARCARSKVRMRSDMLRSRVFHATQCYCERINT